MITVLRLLKVTLLFWVFLLGCGKGGLAGGEPDPDCEPTTCEELGWECGEPSDGCGGTLFCGECTVPGENCVRGRCDSRSCVPYTCEELGAQCGYADDKCGGTTDYCGSCDLPEVCGAGGEPNTCGLDSDGECTGLCPYQVECPAGNSTDLLGTVRMPNGIEPIFDAMVFVPNAPIPEIVGGIVCDRCDDQSFGEMLVGTVTNSDGSFVLRNVPAGVDFPLVVQVGKWRRQVTIPAVEPCDRVTLSADQTRLPRNSSEGDMPRIAISTGAIDGLECVLYKAGVDESEFTTQDGDGRIHLYRANGAWPNRDTWNRCRSVSDDDACTDRDTRECPAAHSICRSLLSDNLYNDQSTLDSYDVVIFGCEASPQERSANIRNRIVDYVNKGGRLFLSHWSFDWIFNYHWPNQHNVVYQTDPLHTTCNWAAGHFSGGLPMSGSCVSPPCVTQAFVDETFEKGVSFSEWLDSVGASSPSSGVVTIQEPRAHCPSTASTGRQWIYTTQSSHGGDSVQQLSFNTPVNAPENSYCGRVVYSAFHVTIGSTGGEWFPNHCSGSLTAQEKILLFMFFDLAACISDDHEDPEDCTPITCDDMKAECGYWDDGCGREIHCGDCPPGMYCSYVEEGGYQCIHIG